MGNFDPFLDYSSITDAMVTDMCGALREMTDAKQEMMDHPSPTALERLMKANDAIEDINGAIQHSISRLPVIVHVAGDIEDEDREDFTIKLQRCVRCKSQLAGWRPGLVIVTESGSREAEPEDMTWHEVGEVIAKAANDTPLLYTVEPEGRDLEPFEHECVGLPNMGEDQ
jgi:hypothetical protein